MKYYCEFINQDLSPEHKHVASNCTTRAMTFVLQPSMTYDEIWDEQHEIAAKRNSWMESWNTTGVWDEVLTKRGYVWRELNYKVRRDKLANILKDIKNPFLSLSSGHVAVINQGTVVDNWDSRYGRVTDILVKKTDIQSINTILTYNNI